MLKFLELVTQRQSTREYQDTAVERADIDLCLEAARLAPSACNSQPWSFIIVDSPAEKNKLADEAFSGIYSMCTFAKQAPVLIVVITERSSYVATLGQYLKGTQYNLIDIGITCEHILLQATELGLGTCWLGWFNEKKVKKALSLPKSTHIDTIISLGYPLKKELRKKNRRSLNEIRKYY